MNLQIVAVQDIPPASSVTDVPDDLVKVYNTCLLMEELCRVKKGVGLAAVQVGIPWRLFVQQSGKVFRYFCNCSYEPVGENKISSSEGCLSIRHNGDGSLRYFMVQRYPQVRIRGFELVAEDRPVLKPVDAVVGGFDAVVKQHEIDHQNGVLISAIGAPMHFYW